MCKYPPFEETRFVTSSGAGNQVTVYNNLIRSNTSTGNFSQFYDWNKLILTSCKRDVLKHRWGSSILKNPKLNTLETKNENDFRRYLYKVIQKVAKTLCFGVQYYSMRAIIKLCFFLFDIRKPCIFKTTWPLFTRIFDIIILSAINYSCM